MEQFRRRLIIRKITYTGIFTSLVIGLGFALVAIPNVEAVTMTVFLSGLFLGPFYGMITGFLGEFLFSVLNPMGSGLAVPFLLIAQVTAMMFVGICGGLLGPVLIKLNPPFKNILLGLTGFTLSAIYNLLTSLSFTLVMGFNFSATLAYLMSGLLFSLIHLLANFLLFTTILPMVHQSVVRYLPEIVTITD